MGVEEHAQVVLEGMCIPPWDHLTLTYVGVTNNIATATYRRGGGSGKIVAALAFTYIASGAADDDDIATITRT